ncbi:MAG TPA: nitroreductase family deazaflavin-dependent oxidoreductase [Solirubrobacteraceae bacterium]|nr:nitroreductase family deazaflavin-dependent oxidoreductase [Solirubrobacteraceae bacterium]
MATQDASHLFGEDHVRSYRETGGDVGHDWKRGTSILLLTTKGRRSGEEHTTPLIYGRSGDELVIVASKGGSDQPPGWYANLQADPEVEVQVRDDVFPARARTASADEKPELWEQMVGEWPDYDAYQERTDREIPVVLLQRR